METYQTLAQSFLASANNNMKRPALWCRDEILTYADFRDAAASIAGTLIRNEIIKPGDRVAILSDRTATVYVGIMAALLAGAAYVPLNPRFPVERNKAILTSSGASVLICNERHRTLLSDLFGGIAIKPAIVLPESIRPAPVNTRQFVQTELATCVTDEELYVGGKGDDLAYVFFTSGSTGLPKGVPISNANVMAYLKSAKQLSGITTADRVIQLVDLTFDLSVHDMFLTWLNGATLYSVPENATLLATRFVEEHEITGWLSVPSAAGLIRQSRLLASDSMPSLRFTFFCGEALTGALAEAWSAAAPNSAIFNIYGPTEATVAFSSFRYLPGQSIPPAIVPLGEPLQDQHMGLFTPQGTRCGNVLGEICLSGSQVMTGYWQSSEITATRFFEAEGRRWYRTGDLGRYELGSGFQFAGRIDHQIKIRGYRVELHEIENVVRRVSGRDMVAVLPWPVTADGAAMGCVAFVVGAAGKSESIMQKCAKYLPEYMIPCQIIFITEMPLNSNGKVDYVSLRNSPLLAT